MNRFRDTLSRFILSSMLTVLSIGSSSVIAADTEIKFADAFIEANKPESFECIDLNLTGVCMYLVFRIYTCPPPKFVCYSIEPEFSAELTHFNPDLLISTYRRLGKSPLDVSKLLYDELQMSVAKPILELISEHEVPADFKATEKWAANTSEGSNKKYKSALQFSEVDVIGHPGNILSHWWDVKENGRSPFEDVSYLVPASIEEGAAQIPNQVTRAATSIADPNNADVVKEQPNWEDHPLTTSLVSQSNNTFITTVAELASIMNDATFINDNVENALDLINTDLFDVLTPVQEAFETVGEIVELADASSEITSTVGGMGGMTSTPFTFCPSDTKMLTPHFLSGSNLIQWRYNIPEIVYPQSYKSSVFPSHQPDFIGYKTNSDPNKNNFWGPLFPRNGHVLQPNPMKANAVAAARAVHVATRDYSHPPNQIHVYSPTRQRNFGEGIRIESRPGPYDINNVKSGKWQLLGSKSDDRCIRFGEGDMEPGVISSTNPATGSLDSFTKEEVPWTYGKQVDDNAYVWSLWREYICCPEPTKAPRDIAFEFWYLDTIDLPNTPLL